MKRRLAAILAADVVGYSRLMEADESGTFAALKAFREELIGPDITEYHGRIVKLMGDGILAEFGSALAAVECAVEIQKTMAEINAEEAWDKRLEFRMGINLGDVLVEGADIYGDGVNVAARLEGLAEAGGICVSENVFQQVKGKLEVEFEDLGERRVKNIAEPIRAYRIDLARVGGQAGAERPPAGRPPPPPSGKPSLAVLAFVNKSGDPEQDYFSGGVTEDIVTELSRFSSLFVIARESSLAHKGAGVKARDAARDAARDVAWGAAWDVAPEVGRELGVAYVLEGSVRKAGERVRVTAQLVEVASGKHIWAERYDRDMADLFAVQDEIARTIAATTGGRVEARGRRRAARLHPTNLKAYDTVLRAQALYYEHSKRAHGEARELLEKAIALDPYSARAHMFLGAIHDMGYWTGWVEEPERSLARARDFAMKAVLLDDTDSLARAQLGEILLHGHAYLDAEIQFRKALEFNPNDIAARALYGSFLTATRRNDEALEQLAAAKRLDPYELGWIPWMRGCAFFTARRYADAIAELKKVERPVNNLRGWLAAACAHAGRPEDARAALRDFLEIAKAEMVAFPKTLDDWRDFWRRDGEYDSEEESRHLFEGLRKAGLG